MHPKPEILIKRHIKVIFITAFLLFVLNKLYLRNEVLNSDSELLLRIIVLSLPNAVEAIMGMFIVVGLLLIARGYFDSTLKLLSDTVVYMLGLFITAIYVFSQEINLHSIGGNNTFDPFDLIASAVGLFISLSVVFVFGFKEN